MRSFARSSRAVSAFALALAVWLTGCSGASTSSHAATPTSIAVSGPPPTATPAGPTPTDLPIPLFTSVDYHGVDATGATFHISVQQGWKATAYALANYPHSYRYTDPTGKFSEIVLVGTTLEAPTFDVGNTALAATAAVAAHEGGTQYVQIGEKDDTLLGNNGYTVSGTFMLHGATYSIQVTMALHDNYPFAFVQIMADSNAPEGFLIADSEQTLYFT